MESLNCRYKDRFDYPLKKFFFSFTGRLDFHIDVILFNAAHALPIYYIGVMIIRCDIASKILEIVYLFDDYPLDLL